MDAGDGCAMSWMHPTYYPISEGLIRVGGYVGCMLADVRCALQNTIKPVKPTAAGRESCSQPATFLYRHIVADTRDMFRSRQAGVKIRTYSDCGGVSTDGNG
jgi:hypothetical protein